MKNELTAQQYQEYALRTVKPMDEREHMCHMVLGLGGEYDELLDALEGDPADKTVMANRVEEVGDIDWFAVNTATKFGFSQATIDADAYTCSGDAFLNLIRATSKITDKWKREFAYGKEFDPKTAYKLLVDLTSAINYAYRQFTDGKINRGQGRFLNIAKLAQRYKDGFTDFEATNRDTGKELKAMIWEETQND